MEYKDKTEITSSEAVSDFDGKTYTDFKFVIHELYGYGALFFNPALVVDGSIEKGEDAAYYSYDFGMDCRVSVVKEKNCLHNYTNDNAECDPVKTVLSSVKYDLLHAFNHYDGDPNYGHQHWALRACLNSRTTSFDWYEDIKEYRDSLTAQMEFDFGS